MIREASEQLRWLLLHPRTFYLLRTPQAELSAEDALEKAQLQGLAQQARAVARVIDDMLVEDDETDAELVRAVLGRMPEAMA